MAQRWIVRVQRWKDGTIFIASQRRWGEDSIFENEMCRRGGPGIEQTPCQSTQLKSYSHKKALSKPRVNSDMKMRVRYMNDRKRIYTRFRLPRGHTSLSLFALSTNKRTHTIHEGCGKM